MVGWQPHPTGSALHRGDTTNTANPRAVPRIETPRLLRYHCRMNKPSDPKRARLWTDPPAAPDAPVAGYDDWLARDIARGIADLDAGKATPLEKMRKEFGLE